MPPKSRARAIRTRHFVGPNTTLESRALRKVPSLPKSCSVPRNVEFLLRAHDFLGAPFATFGRRVLIACARLFWGGFRATGGVLRPRGPDTLWNGLSEFRTEKRRVAFSYGENGGTCCFSKITAEKRQITVRQKKSEMSVKAVCLKKATERSIGLTNTEWHLVTRSFGFFYF